MREVSTRFITYDRDVFTLANRGWYSADIGKVILEGAPFADVGNVVNHLSENPHAFYERCHKAALAILHRKAFPVFIGGDHSISAPLIRACGEVYKDLHTYSLRCTYGSGRVGLFRQSPSRQCDEPSVVRESRFGNLPVWDPRLCRCAFSSQSMPRDTTKGNRC